MHCTRASICSGPSMYHPFAFLTLMFAPHQLPFPIKLHDMLDEVTKNSASRGVVSWRSHGKAFRVHQPEVFARAIMPHYFNQTKYKSFQRQLHIYGFHRITKGMDKGAYCHNLFIQNKKAMSMRMVREKTKRKTGKQNHSQKDAATEVPDFYKTMINKKEDHSPSNNETNRDFTITMPEPVPSKSFFSGVTAPEKNTYSSDVVAEQKVQLFTDTIDSVVVKEHIEDGDEAFFEGKRFHFMPAPAGDYFFASATARGGPIARIIEHVEYMPSCA
jgi:hypothetical protein